MRNRTSKNIQPCECFLYMIKKNICLAATYMIQWSHSAVLFFVIGIIGWGERVRAPHTLYICAGAYAYTIYLEKVRVFSTTTPSHLSGFQLQSEGRSINWVNESAAGMRVNVLRTMSCTCTLTLFRFIVRILFYSENYLIYGTLHTQEETVCIYVIWSVQCYHHNLYIYKWKQRKPFHIKKKLSH